MNNGTKFTRRHALGLLGGAAAAPVLAPYVRAQDDNYPARDIRIICAYPAGSGADVLVRFYAEFIKPAFNRPVIIENRPGANGNLATTFVARAKPDGYTLFIHSPAGLAANDSTSKPDP